MKCVEVVYDNRKPDIVTLPEKMGTPNPDQFLGTPLEKLTETAGRSCYDSYGKGRSSAEYHDHIKEVGHLSVYAHANITIFFSKDIIGDSGPLLFAEAIMNRPGIFYRVVDENSFTLTLNARNALEWFEPRYALASKVSKHIGREIQQQFKKAMPNTFNHIKEGDMFSTRVYPAHPEEIWVSVWLRGSRGFSHEQVRHGAWAGISQRSTRYVDESESDMCLHPILQDLEPSSAAYTAMASVIEQSRTAYKLLVTELMEEGHSRKQARGAARGILGNMLETQMIYSASLAQWKHIWEMRCSPHADAEIRDIMVAAREVITNG